LKEDLTSGLLNISNVQRPNGRPRIKPYPKGNIARILVAREYPYDVSLCIFIAPTMTTPPNKAPANPNKSIHTAKAFEIPHTFSKAGLIASASPKSHTKSSDVKI
jgi:hypothetical protein